jgi:hypothetical protein
MLPDVVVTVHGAANAGKAVNIIALAKSTLLIFLLHLVEARQHH